MQVIFKYQRPFMKTGLCSQFFNNQEKSKIKATSAAKHATFNS